MLGSDAAPQPVTWTSAYCLEEFALTLILMSAQGDAYPELTEVPEYEEPCARKAWTLPWQPSDELQAFAARRSFIRAPRGLRIRAPRGRQGN